MNNIINMYDVYQWFPHIGRYGEHKVVATYRNEEDAKGKVQRILTRGITSSYKPRSLNNQWKHL